MNLASNLLRHRMRFFYAGWRRKSIPSKVGYHQTRYNQVCTCAKRNPPQNLASNSKPKSELKTTVCHFYQRGTCQKDKDHETGQAFYKHVYATCFSMGKEYRFIYLGFYVAFNIVQVISRRVVGRAEETST